jgi:tetratricopeptide (TPR) repeat protein/WD40 repeat protein
VAFRDAGLGAEGDDAEAVAALVRASAVADELVGALDDWASVANDPRRRAWLLEVARRADPDGWRDRFRDPTVWHDRAKLQELAKELLADERKLARQKPQLLASLGFALLLTQGEAQPLLAAAQARYPDDFWLNSYLGDAFLVATRWDEAIAFFRAAVAVHPSGAAVHHNLGNALAAKEQLNAAIWEYRTAVALDPKFAPAHYGLGIALYAQQQVDAAIQEYRTAIDLDPELPLAHFLLVSALFDKHQLDAAIQASRTAIDLDPKDALMHYNLGRALYDKGELDAAIREYRTAIDLARKDAKPPKSLGNSVIVLDKPLLDAVILPWVHCDLGRALYDKHQPDEAIREFRTSIDLDPKYAVPHNGVGNALYHKGELGAAIREYRTAIDLDPKYPDAHNGLGNALGEKGQLDAAIQEYRAAIALDPKRAMADNGLGNALRDKGELDAAIREYRTAIDLGPRYAWPRNNLGNVLVDEGELDAAVQEYRTAIALDPKDAKVHGNLAAALLDLGQLAEAVQSERRCLELLRPEDTDRPSARRQLEKYQQILALDRRLPAILEGKDRPANDAERLALGRLCVLRYQKRYAASCRFYGEAFAHNARLADDMQEPDRYNAACAAALAGSGKGNDAAGLDEKERARLRRQALDWLRADLALRAQQAASDKPQERASVRQELQHWQQDADLAGLRDPAAVAKLPAHEQPACRKLWADVAELRSSTWVVETASPFEGAHVYRVTFSPDGRYFLVAGDAGGRSPVRIYSGRTGQLASQFVPDEDVGWSGGAFSPDGTKVVSWGSTSAALYVWESATARQLLKLEGHKAAVGQAAFSPDARRIVSGSADKTLRIWDATTGKQLLVLKGHAGDCGGFFSPDDRWIVSSGTDNTLRGWDAATGKEAWKHTGHALYDFTFRRSSLFSPDGARVLSLGTDGSVDVWEVATGKAVAKLAGVAEAQGASFLPGGRQLASWGKDKTLRVWDVTGGKEVRSLALDKNVDEEPDKVAVSPDGRMVLSAHGEMVRVSDLATGEELDQFPLVSGTSARSLAFSPDSRMAAAGSFRAWVYLWRLPAPAEK